MPARIGRVRTVLGAVVTEIRTENITFMAGSIAYHAFVSLLPLLVLLLTVAGALGNRSVEGAIFEVARAMLSQGAGETFIRELQTSTRSTGLSLLGGVVLLWGTLRIFRGLDTAFSDIYETEAANSFLDQLRDGLVVLVAVALAIVVSGWLTDLVQIGDPALDWVAGRLTAVVGLGLAFLPMYVVFPDTDVSVAEVVPGTLFAAVGLTAFQTLFGLYLDYSSGGDEGTIIGGVIVLLTWLYFSGLVLLVGVAINAVLANRTLDVDIDPVFGDETSGRAGQSPVAASREEVVDAVERMQALLGRHDRVTVTGGDEAVSVPTPTHVIGDTDAPLLLSRGRPVQLELQWTPRPGAARSDDGDGGGRAGETDEGDGDGEAWTERGDASGADADEHGAPSSPGDG